MNIKNREIREKGQLKNSHIRIKQNEIDQEE